MKGLQSWFTPVYTLGAYWMCFSSLGKVVKPSDWIADLSIMPFEVCDWCLQCGAYFPFFGNSALGNLLVVQCSVQLSGSELLWIIRLVAHSCCGSMTDRSRSFLMAVSVCTDCDIRRTWHDALSGVWSTSVYQNRRALRCKVKPNYTSGHWGLDQMSDSDSGTTRVIQDSYHVW